MYRTAVNGSPQIFYIPLLLHRPCCTRKAFRFGPLLKNLASMLLLFVTAKK